MKSLTIRNMDSQLSRRLKDIAAKRDISLNSCILSILRRSTGISKKQFSKTYDDLDDLSRDWSKRDYDQFSKSIKSLSEVDREMWE